MMLGIGEFIEANASSIRILKARGHVYKEPFIVNRSGFLGFGRAINWDALKTLGFALIDPNKLEEYVSKKAKGNPSAIRPARITFEPPLRVPNNI
ncbi:MAG: hypothetical protein VKK59_00555 [Vampirovibrionales bacterium]|nr:hypothetical protein [Vampirovibrionales bacterium]